MAPALMCPSAQAAAPLPGAVAGSSPSSCPARPQPSAWDWECGMCTFLNQPASNPCEMCGLPRGTRPEEPTRAAPLAGSTAGQQAPLPPNPGRLRSTRVLPGRDAGRELLAFLKGGAQLPDAEAADRRPPPPSAGREILAALECNKGKQLTSPAEQLLAMLRRGGPAEFEEDGKLAMAHVSHKGLFAQQAEGVDSQQRADDGEAGGTSGPGRRQRQRARGRARGRAAGGAQRCFWPGV
mmetsp:Transcript_50607/g.159324  ORF Transcript_50607/g.159324 Transcript_50607/m.159324 type:complete len:238 (-) Transcript_50607:28-741(-)